MILIDKKVGETPLELINRIRIEMPELKDERLSYAGRLDPMAEGQMLILVGDENDNREKYLGLDKEYEAEFWWAFLLIVEIF
jgi:tRNA U55 pseudouridine synthase TruB